MTPTSASAGPGTGWSVTSQTETPKLNTANAIEDGVTVGFRTQYGQPGSVWIPKAGYTPETVRAAITEHAATMDAVHNLSG